MLSRVLVVLSALFLAAASHGATISFGVNPLGSGSTNPSGTVTREKGTYLIQATPASGYTFWKWAITSTPPNTVTIFDLERDATYMEVKDEAQEATITAYFVVARPSLTMKVTPLNSGTTIPTGTTIVAYDQQVVITAMPIAPYVFERWEASPTSAGAITNTTAATTTVRVTGEVTVTAYFRMEGAGPALVYNVKTNGNLIANRNAEYFREIPGKLQGLFAINYNAYDEPQFPPGFANARMLLWWESKNAKYYFEPDMSSLQVVIRRDLSTDGDRFVMSSSLFDPVTRSGYAQLYYSGKMRKKKASDLGLDQGSNKTPGMVGFFVAEHIDGSIVIQSFAGADVFTGGLPVTGSMAVSMDFDQGRTYNANMPGGKKTGVYNPLSTFEIIQNRITQLKRKGFQSYNP